MFDWLIGIGNLNIQVAVLNWNVFQGAWQLVAV